MNIEMLFSQKDIWSYLQKSSKPIVLYGMGDGADKILNVCDNYKIQISGVFASDDFVRNQNFRNFTVRKYSYFKETFKDFIVLVSFASQLPEVIERIINISKETELYCPDVPVYGENLFTEEFLLKNKCKFEEVLKSLSDKQSIKVFINTILFKLTGLPKYLIDCESKICEAYSSFVKPSGNDVYVDIGAYKGDTVSEYISFAKNYKQIYAFEPDKKNFQKLTNCINEKPNITAYNVAAWDKDETLIFNARSGRNSTQSILGTRNKIIEISANSIDNLITEKIDYIKVDVEGAEKEVINGMKNQIVNFSPTLNLAIYHRSEDIFNIPLQILKINRNYNLYMRHFSYIPCWDTNLYAVKKSEE